MAYFRNALYNLMAMLRTLGPPTLFMTLYADDLHWPELGMALENLSYSEAINKKKFISCMRSDPILTATHFERRFSALMKFIIKGDKKPLGTVTDYFIRVEFQNRGSAHYHIFFWIQDIPTIITDSSIPPILAYLDEVVHTDLPDRAQDYELYSLTSNSQSFKVL